MQRCEHLILERLTSKAIRKQACVVFRPLSLWWFIINSNGNLIQTRWITSNIGHPWRSLLLLPRSSTHSFIYSENWIRHWTHPYKNMALALREFTVECGYRNHHKTIFYRTSKRFAKCYAWSVSSRLVKFAWGKDTWSVSWTMSSGSIRGRWMRWESWTVIGKKY